MAGHSKWANIQHRKGRQDAVRSKLFSKISKEITVAAKLGEPDVDKNPRLRLAVKEARANSVPKDVIERAIKKSQTAENTNYEEIRYEGYGPGGIAIIAEALTDNRNRTASNVRSIFMKFGGNLGETGSVAFMFERLGLIAYPSSSGSEESMMELAINSGAIDMEKEDDVYVFFCESSDLAFVSEKIENDLGDSLMTKLIWKPQNFVEASNELVQTASKLMEALENDEDVQSVHSNLVFS